MKMNRKYISYLMVALAVGFAASCTYDEKDELAGKGISRIFFSASGESEYTGLTTSVTAFDNEKQTRPVVEFVRTATSPSDLAQTVTVTYTIDENLWAAENDSLNLYGETPYTLLPEGSYSFLNSDGSVAPKGTITFAPGVSNLGLALQIDPTTLNLANVYGLPIHLSSPSNGYILSGGTDVVLVVIVKNQWDGTYSKIGTRYNFNANTPWPTADAAPSGYASTIAYSFAAVPVATVGARTVTIYAAQLDGGFGTVDATINEDNSVTIAPNATTGINAAEEVPNHKSSYDPDTKTFHIAYQYTNTSGTFRYVVEDYVYKGPR